MKVVFIIILALALIAFLYITSPIWLSAIIERTKGKVFRIVKEGGYYYAEKRLLWVFFIRLNEYGLNTRKGCIDYIQHFIQGHETKKEIIDFSNQVSDPKRLLVSGELKTKRIKTKR